MLRKWFAFPAVRAAAIAVLALALVLAVPSTRALAGKLLNLFRVQQVTVLPIDSTGLESMTGDKSLGSQLSKLISDSTEVTEKPGEPVVVANAKDASASAGFNVRLPADVTPSKIYVTGSSAFKFTVNRTKAQAFIESAGRSDLVLPNSIDGAEVTVSIPANVNATFGTCPEPQIEKPQAKTMEAPRDSYLNCVAFIQMPSPLVNAPDGVDVAQLAQIGLEFSGMTKEEAAAFTSTVDWTSTLVVPIPRNAATYEDVSVDGVTGKLIKRTAAQYSSEYALLWIKNGIVYNISGAGTDASRAFEIVKALP